MKAWELIQSTGWCQGEYATADSFSDVAPDSERAACFCIMGALMRCYGTGSYAYTQAVEKAAACLPSSVPVLGISAGARLVRWNDMKGRTKQDVVQLLQEAGV